MTGMVHKAGESAPSSSGAISLMWKAEALPLPWCRPQREPTCPTTTMLVAPKEEKVTSQEMPPPAGLSEAIAGLHAPNGAAGGPLIPYCILNWHFLLGPSSESTWRAPANCTSVGSVKSIPLTGTQWWPTAFKKIWGSITFVPMRWAIQIPQSSVSMAGGPRTCCFL